MTLNLPVRVCTRYTAPSCKRHRKDSEVPLSQPNHSSTIAQLMSND